MSKKIAIDILPNTHYTDEKGIYNQHDAMLFSGKAAGICYDKEGFNHLKDEP